MRLLVRDTTSLYAYWEISDDALQDARAAGGRRLTLRLHDVTGAPLSGPEMRFSIEYACEEGQSRGCLPDAVPGRAYLAELGYHATDGRWLPLAFSNSASTPPDRRSPWVEDRFVMIPWSTDLRSFEAPACLRRIPAEDQAPSPAAWLRPTIGGSLAMLAGVVAFFFFDHPAPRTAMAAPLFGFGLLLVCSGLGTGQSTAPSASRIPTNER